MRGPELASEQLRFLGDLITYGPVDLVESPRFVDLLTGALAATPQINSIVFINSELRMTRAVRGSGAATYSIKENRQVGPAVRAAVSAARKTIGATWGKPVSLNRYTLASVNLHRPVRREGTFVGVLVALVSLDKLSDFVAGLEVESGKTVFILYDHEYVLAHSLLSGGFPGLSKEKPLPTIFEIDDPVMAAMGESHPHQEIEALRFEGGGGHMVEVGGEPFVFMHREIGSTMASILPHAQEMLRTKMIIALHVMARSSWAIGLRIYLHEVYEALDQIMASPRLRTRNPGY